MKNTLSFYIFILLLAACNKDKGNDNNDDMPNPDAAEYFFKGKLATGEMLDFKIAPASTAEMVEANDGIINPPNCMFDYGSRIGTTLGQPGEKSITILFPDRFAGNCSDQLLAFPNMFTPTPYLFGETANTMLVRYFDGTETWKSLPQFQYAQSFIEITDSTRVQSPQGGMAMKISGKLSCNLINAAQNAEMVLDSASFVLLFEPEL